MLVSGLARWTFVPTGSEAEAKAIELPLSPMGTLSEQGVT